MLIVVVLPVASGPAPASAQEPEHISRADVKRLIAQANKPGDFQILATFFHLQEDTYRAKAQNVMDDYAACVRHFLMAPKFPTRADQDFRLFDYYSAKADAQARLAAHYDDLLLARGIKPRPKTPTVSMHDLQNSPLSRTTFSQLH